MASNKKLTAKSQNTSSKNKAVVKKTSKFTKKEVVKSAKSVIKTTAKKLTTKEPKSYSYINRDGKRVRKVTHHRSFRLSKREVIKTKKIPRIKILVKETNRIFWNNKILFLKFVLLFSVLDFMFVKGLGSSFNLVSTKQSLVELFGGSNSLEASALLMGQLVGSSSVSATNSSGAYHYFLVIVIILTAIWLVRKIHSDDNPSLKEALYNAMAPLIKFIVVLFIVTIQLIPALIGGFLINTVFNNGLAVTSFEKMVWIIFYVGLLLISLYMILSSMFALVITTLDGVNPMTALRSARDIVMHRRMKIVARLIILSAILLIGYVVIFLPLIFYIPVVAEPLFLAVSTFSLIYSTVYIYNLYRQLI